MHFRVTARRSLTLNRPSAWGPMKQNRPLPCVTGLWGRVSMALPKTIKTGTRSGKLPNQEDGMSASLSDNILDSTTSGILAVDLEGRILFVNTMLSKRLGI